MPVAYDVEYYGADITGCGMKACNETYAYGSVVSCMAACVNEKGCNAFNWAPKNGSAKHVGEKICSLYPYATPSGRLPGGDGLYRQVLCKMESPRPVFIAADVFYKNRRHAPGATVVPVLNAVGGCTFPLGGGAKPWLGVEEMQKYAKSVPLTFPAGEVLIEVDVRLDWRDQGRGNQRGGVRIELRRDSGGGSTFTVARKWFEFGFHTRTAETFSFALLYGTDAIVTDAEDGDHVLLGVRVGEYSHKLFLHSMVVGVKYGTLPSTRQLGEL
eukprot:g7945.t1